jgi:hypothetical protein
MMLKIIALFVFAAAVVYVAGRMVLNWIYELSRDWNVSHWWNE